jgi:biotin carboxyl carrier protein
MTYEVLINGHPYSLDLAPGPRPGEWVCHVREGNNQREYRFDAAASGSNVLSLLFDGKSLAFERDPASGALTLGGRRYEVDVRDPRSLRSRRAASQSSDGPRQLTAPMPGKVVRILAAAGASVEAGQGVLVVEAMKMQNELKSPKSGRVQKVLVAEGAPVNAGDVLAVVE